MRQFKSFSLGVGSMKMGTGFAPMGFIAPQYISLGIEWVAQVSLLRPGFLLAQGRSRNTQVF
jgi:hypothetical protein